MPIIFVHGVNTRDGEGYRKDVAARDTLMRRLLVAPLAERGLWSEDTPILNPYWGRYGVRFRWDHASVPDVKALEHLGGADGTATPESDAAFADLVTSLGANGAAETGATETGGLEALGGSDGPIKRAATADLPRFAEGVMLPILLGERDLALRTGDDERTVGEREALLLIAADEAAHDPDVQRHVASAPTDDAVMERLEAAVRTRYEALVLDSDLVSADEAAAASGGLEALGGPGWLSGLKDRVGELFTRAKRVPARAATLALSDWKRGGAHERLTQFFGDVFVYLNERGTPDAPGPIVREVLGAIRTARDERPDESLVVVTHSMGGNVLYDLLTDFAPDLELDAWVSVGGQVGQFEEMKLFRRSDPDLGAPHKVSGLAPRVGTWLNVYDPADALSFRAEPVFADARDALFKTGASVFKAHGDYFKRPRFYRLVREHLESST